MDQRVKSSGEIAGYSGDVLKADLSVREGKGVQSFLNGTVMDGYFASNKFVKGRLIDSMGNQITGVF